MSSSSSAAASASSCMCSLVLGSIDQVRNNSSTAFGSFTGNCTPGNGTGGDGGVQMPSGKWARRSGGFQDAEPVRTIHMLVEADVGGVGKRITTCIRLTNPG